MTTWNAGYLIGSIARASINRRLAGALVAVGRQHLRSILGFGEFVAPWLTRSLSRIAGACSL